MSQTSLVVVKNGALGTVHIGPLLHCHMCEKNPMLRLNGVWHGVICLYGFNHKMREKNLYEMLIWNGIVQCWNRFSFNETWWAEIIAGTRGGVRNDSETHETVLLDCTTGEAGSSRHSRRMRNLQFYESGKRSMHVGVASLVSVTEVDYVNSHVLCPLPVVARTPSMERECFCFISNHTPYSTFFRFLRKWMPYKNTNTTNLKHSEALSVLIDHKLYF